MTEEAKPKSIIERAKEAIASKLAMRKRIRADRYGIYEDGDDVETPAQAESRIMADASAWQRFDQPNKGVDMPPGFE